jgi:hypothetical protein
MLLASKLGSRRAAGVVYFCCALPTSFVNAPARQRPMQTIALKHPSPALAHLSFLTLRKHGERKAAHESGISLYASSALRRHDQDRRAELATLALSLVTVRARNP